MPLNKKLNLNKSKKKLESRVHGQNIVNENDLLEI